MLEKGYSFPEIEFELTTQWVADYVSAVEDAAIDTNSTPPMALATQMIRCLLTLMPLPPGALHGSQELEFLRPVTRNEQFVLQSQVANSSIRQGLEIVAIDIILCDKNGLVVMKGRSTIMNPAL